ncbi:hypothetical protein I79_013597 [Cricetulus griseus]|uniref:Uncharacterized protein n=1 Tax=Cricetulus griseus TaxID=10029 RepID=G3HRX3_CRIGR|nr:hypothetical protein I79_013597 [Cricetulus griseus]
MPEERKPWVMPGCCFLLVIGLKFNQTVKRPTGILHYNMEPFMVWYWYVNG